LRIDRLDLASDLDQDAGEESNMAITLTEELERDVLQRANLLGLPPDELVRRAMAWFFQMEPDLAEELREWQQMTWNSWAKVEESLQ
jgi:hypothetical protein